MCRPRPHKSQSRTDQKPSEESPDLDRISREDLVQEPVVIGFAAGQIGCLDAAILALALEGSHSSGQKIVRAGQDEEHTAHVQKCRTQVLWAAKAASSRSGISRNRMGARSRSREVGEPWGT